MRLSPIRVLHCLSAIASGGVEVRHRFLSLHLSHSRFEHRFIGTTGGPVAEALQADHIPVTLLGPVASVANPYRYRAALKLARAWSPDLVHGAVMEGSLLGVYLARRLRVPMIYEETSDPQNRRPMGHNLARLIAAGSTRCVAVSPSVGVYLTDQLRVPNRKVQVIANGVPRPEPLSDNERSALRASLGIVSSDIVIGTVSRLFDDHKRVSDLIIAFTAIANTDGRLHLVVVGSGPDQGMLEDLATGTVARSRIHFVGRQIPADRFYGIMEIFALASSREAFGLVAAEAMRAGLPVVTTNVGGLAGIVNDRETGYLVPPLQPDSLGRALERLVADASLRRAMGEAGQRRADEHFSLGRYLRDVEELYLDLTDNEHEAER